MTRPLPWTPRLTRRTTPCPIVEARKALTVAKTTHDQHDTIESAARVQAAFMALEVARKAPRV